MVSSYTESKGNIMEVKAKLLEIAKEFSLEIIYAFGSQAKAVAGFLQEVGDGLSVPPTSDIDIGIKPSGEKALSVKEKVNLQIEFEDLLSANRVDLVVLSEADPFLAANIIRGELLYARDTHFADEYELYILRRAGDLAPLERERMALILGVMQ